jgi:hypothetical protein
VARQALAWPECAQYMRAWDAYEADHLKQLQPPSYTYFTRSLDRLTINPVSLPPFLAQTSLKARHNTYNELQQHIHIHGLFRLIKSAAGLPLLLAGESRHSGVDLTQSVVPQPFKPPTPPKLQRGAKTGP